MKHSGFGLSAAAMAAFGVFALVGCGSVSAPPVNVSPTPVQTYGPTTASVYVLQTTTTSTDQVLKFAAGSSGAVTPSLTITTNLSATAVAVDKGGNIYVGGKSSATGLATINTYAANSNITGTFTVPYTPLAIAVGPTGTLYVTDTVGEILVFPAGASSPSQTITSTAIATPQGIAVDSAGTIYVASYSSFTGASTIAEFNAAANGSATPTNSITAPSNVAFTGVAVDGSMNVYATTDSLTATVSSVVKYAAGATGAATPVSTITGSATLLSSGTTDVGAVALDSAGNIYFPLETQVGTNSFSYSVLEFGATANGNVAPTASVSSPAWNSAGAQLAVL